MPNQPKTPGRSVRVSDDLWAAAKDVAVRRGETLTEVIVEALSTYVLMHSPQKESTPDGHR